jgi:predicted permease
MLNDVRQAVRALRRHPAFTAVVVITLALGIGANTALFSVADAVLLRPLPYPEPDRLAWIDGAPFRFGKKGFTGLAKQFHESPAFENGGLYATGAVNIGGDAGAERVRAAAVTAGFLPALKVAPAAGRAISEEDVLSEARVAVVSQNLARRRGGLGPGSTFLLNGRTFTVIGVMPARVDFPARSDVWIPMGADLQITGRALAPRTLARLAPGVTPQHAAAEIERIEALRYGRPRDPREKAPDVVPLGDKLVGPVRPLFLAVFGAVFLVLLVACINTANLLLARVSAREREMSVRRALGASRLRLVRHLLVESAVLSLAAGVAALPVALWTLDAIAALLPPDLHTSGAIAIDGRAVAATAALSVVATLLFGIAPAWSLRRTTGGGVLRGTPSATADPFWRRFRSGLVVAEIAIALVLIAAAATIVNTVATLMRADIGVSGERALTMETTLPLARYDTGARLAAFHSEVGRAAGALPGVEAVGATSLLPGSNEVTVARGIDIGGLPKPEGDERFVLSLSVTPGYFRAIGLAMIAGRAFAEADRQDTDRVAIVSESVARAVGVQPPQLVGRQIQVGLGEKLVAATIVGVARDVRMAGPEHDRGGQLYQPLAQAPAYGTTFLVVKSTTRPAALAAAVRAAIASIDSDLPLYNVRTFDEIKAAFLADRRFAMTVIGAFGLLATALAGVGLYGVLTYLVQLRTREIGIRVALGASPGAVRWQMMRTGLRHGAAGIVLGSAAAAALTRAVISRIDGIQPAGVPLLMMVALSMLTMATVVTWLPARRATSINPVAALRTDE